MDRNKIKEYADEKKILENHESPLDQWKRWADDDMFLNMTKNTNVKVKDVVDRVKPDLVVVDVAFILPSAVKNYPWINLITPNPNTILFDERSPPPGCGKIVSCLPEFCLITFLLGLPANDPNSWKKYHEEIKSIFAPMLKKLDDFYVSEGLPKRKVIEWYYHSPYLNIYHYPLELDYTDLRPNPPNWIRIDTFMIKSKEEFVVPEKLKNLPGKLIYYSLGSLSSINIELMKRLIGFLSSSPHRFIVSKGAFGDKYELPDNFWGDNFVPQTAVLKVVDLAIIHGGNNSLCETFYYGKPMIFMPLFADQPDNAQRVHEKGFGIRMNPFTCSKEELLGAIETLLNNKELHNKMKLIAERCERESKSNQILELIQQVVSK